MVMSRECGSLATCTYWCTCRDGRVFDLGATVYTGNVVCSVQTLLKAYLWGFSKRPNGKLRT